MDVCSWLLRHGICIVQQRGEAFACHAIESPEQQLQGQIVRHVDYAIYLHMSGIALIRGGFRRSGFACLPIYGTFSPLVRV